MILHVACLLLWNFNWHFVCLTRWLSAHADYRIQLEVYCFTTLSIRLIVRNKINNYFRMNKGQTMQFSKANIYVIFIIIFGYSKIKYHFCSKKSLMIPKTGNQNPYIEEGQTTQLSMSEIHYNNYGIQLQFLVSSLLSESF